MCNGIFYISRVIVPGSPAVLSAEADPERRIAPFRGGKNVSEHHDSIYENTQYPPREHQERPRRRRRRSSPAAAVLKVLGTIRGDIFKMFLTEALIVGVIGGAAGLILSFIAKWLIPVIFASQELRCVLPWWLAVCGVVFAGAVAIAAAWMPARKATLISPNEAIRSE